MSPRLALHIGVTALVLSACEVAESTTGEPSQIEDVTGGDGGAVDTGGAAGDPDTALDNTDTPVDTGAADDLGVDLADTGLVPDVPEDLDAGGPDAIDSDVADIRPDGTGSWEDPILIDGFPFVATGDTRNSAIREADAYSCAPATNESGAEVVYQIVGSFAGILEAEVEVSDDGVDPDIHLLAGPDPDECLVRDHTGFTALIRSEDQPYLVVDTWVNDEGVELPGPYTLTADLVPLPGGDCLMEEGELRMVNRTEPLALPALGEVVLEAHLVTTEEFPGTWPTSARDGIPAHYALSESASGYPMDRSEPWAPEGEGGSEWGQGSTVRPPPIDEAWYVNMYWRDRPTPGTRMLVFNPQNGRAVVTSAGYETGPGSAERIGGACEEVHDHLGTVHRSRLVMGFPVDQDLPLGPIDCGE